MSKPAKGRNGPASKGKSRRQQKDEDEFALAEFAELAEQEQRVHAQKGGKSAQEEDDALFAADKKKLLRAKLKQQQGCCETLGFFF